MIIIFDFMKIDPRQLMQLSAIVETGGLTEAAALLGTSQPALSRMLTALEARALASPSCCVIAE